MKITEIITESKNLDEAPNVLGRAAKALGISAKQAASNIGQKTINKIKQTGLGVASKFSNRAAGSLAVSKEANELTKDFKFYVGSSKKPQTAETLITFLKQEGHPVTAVQNILNKNPEIKQNPQQPLSSGIINQVMNSVASELVSTGKVQTSTPSYSSQTSSNNNPTPLKQTVNKLRVDQKQELIDFLKSQTDASQLKF